MHEKGEPLERALPDAGIERIRPVMITVGATILALFPLALEGGPALETSLLCPDWWTRRRNLHHLALGPGLLFDFCPRSQVDQMGNGGEPTGGHQNRTSDNVMKWQAVQIFRRSISETAPQGRHGTPEDVAGLVSFPLSDTPLPRPAQPNSVSDPARACHQHASYVLLSVHSVIGRPSGAS